MPDKSTLIHDIAGNGVSVYMLLVPNAHITMVGPVRDIWAAFGSPLFACLVHVMVVLPPACVIAMLDVPDVGLVTIVDRVLPRRSYCATVPVAGKPITALFLDVAVPAMVPVVDMPTDILQ